MPVNLTVDFEKNIMIWEHSLDLSTASPELWLRWYVVRASTVATLMCVHIARIQKLEAAARAIHAK